MATGYQALCQNFLDRMGLDAAPIDVNDIESYKEALREGYENFVAMLHKNLPRDVPSKWRMEDLTEYGEVLDSFGVEISPEVSGKLGQIRHAFSDYYLGEAVPTVKRIYRLQEIKNSPPDDALRKEFLKGYEYEFDSFVSDVIYYFNRYLNAERFDSCRIFDCAGKKTSESDTRFKLESMANEQIKLDDAKKVLQYLGSLYRGEQDEFFRLKELFEKRGHLSMADGLSIEERNILERFFVKKKLNELLRQDNAEASELICLGTEYSDGTGPFDFGC